MGTPGRSRPGFIASATNPSPDPGQDDDDGDEQQEDRAEQAFNRHADGGQCGVIGLAALSADGFDEAPGVTDQHGWEDDEGPRAIIVVQLFPDHEEAKERDPAKEGEEGDADRPGGSAVGGGAPGHRLTVSNETNEEN
jgi:hypothetical protein